MKLGLGICARNEEAGIIATITSVVHSARSAHSLEWELIVCANGCTDGTVALVNQWLLNNKAFAVTLEVLDVANLVDAQRLVVNRLGDRGASAIVLFDADILVDMECVPELLRTADNPSIKAAYARSVPTKSAQETIIEKVLNQYDSINTIFSERRHLHGRAFLIKEWSIPETEPPLLADDIYMSCDLLDSSTFMQPFPVQEYRRSHSGPS
jgi:glycosyltransferase involved in cell wall biosynthesis